MNYLFNGLAVLKIPQSVLVIRDVPKKKKKSRTFTVWQRLCLRPRRSRANEVAMVSQDHPVRRGRVSIAYSALTYRYDPLSLPAQRRAGIPRQRRRLAASLWMKRACQT